MDTKSSLALSVCALLLSQTPAAGGDPLPLLKIESVTASVEGSGSGQVLGSSPGEILCSFGFQGSAASTPAIDPSNQNGTRFFFQGSDIFEERSCGTVSLPLARAEVSVSLLGSTRDDNQLICGLSFQSGLAALFNNNDLSETSSASISGHAEMLFETREWLRASSFRAFSSVSADTVVSDTGYTIELIGPLTDGFAELVRHRVRVVRRPDGTVDSSGSTPVGSLMLSPGTYRYRVELSGSTANSTDNFPGNTGIQMFGGGLGFDYVPDDPPSGENGDFALDIDDDSAFTPADLLAWLAGPVDVDADGEIDPDPYGADATLLALFLNATGHLGDDCNGNRFPDAYDIAVGEAAGGSADANADGVPDECAEACNIADLGEPLGVLDIDDVLTFLTAFAQGNAAADLAPPFGVLDIDDVLTFLAAFASGCP